MSAKIKDYFTCKAGAQLIKIEIGKSSYDRIQIKQSYNLVRNQ